MVLNKISAVILTKNSQKHIKKVLEALTKLDEVVIVDNHSTDKTLSIAKEFKNVKLYQEGFIGFGPLKKKAISYASNEWVLSIDSDEVVSAELVDEILNLKLDEACWYSFEFSNYYGGKHIKCCGWYPDRHIRLFCKKSATFDEAYVHENLTPLGEKDLKEIKLTSKITHYSYSNLSDFLIKMERYSTLFAIENRGKKSSSPLKALGRGVFTFFKNYILQRGFLCGYEGFVISCYNAQTTFWKYMKLYEIDKKVDDR